MPKAGGLPDVTQRFDGDSTGYTRAADEVVVAAIKMAKENKNAIDDIIAATDKFGAASRIMANDFNSMITVSRDVINVQKEMVRSLDDIQDAHTSFSRVMRAQAEQANDLISTYKNMGDAAREVTAHQHEIAQSFLETLDPLDRLEAHYGTHATAIKSWNDMHDQQIDKLVTLRQEIAKTGEAVAKTSIFATPFTPSGGTTVAYTGDNSIAAYADSLKRAQKVAADAEKSISASHESIRRQYEIPLNVPPPSGYGAYGGDRGGGIPGAVAARALQSVEESNRFMSILPGLLAGGGLSALGGLAASGQGGAILRGAGRGLGYAGGAIGGAFGGGPSAADTSRIVTGFIRRWYPAAHWAMMLSNELLATVGPAVAAGGMGALTGVQGFEQLIPRGKAVFNTSEALGDSLGMTTGKAWGLKTAYLQNAQDLATGMATELAGAAKNIIASPGTGDTFSQLGLNTDAMFSRFAATLTARFQKGGLGGKLGDLVTGGTGYLQQFGDVLANLGDTFLNTAPNLPGVGGDLLSTLTGATGGLAHATGWLGSALGPLLAGEAGLRWCPALVGTAGRGIAGLGNILGNMGRGGILSRIGVGNLARYGLQERGGLAGIGAVLSGLGAPEIGGIAAGAYYLNKAYTYQTPTVAANNKMLEQIGQMGFVPGYSASITAMQQLSGLKPGGNLMAGASLGNIGGGLKAIYSGVNAWSPSQAWGGAVRVGHGLLQMGQQIMGGGVKADLTPYEANQAAIDKLAGSMVNALNAGGQIQSQWKKLSGSAIDMGKATDVATMAQLQLGSSFQKNGQLSDQAKTMIANLYAGYAPMHMNQGMFGAAVGAQTAMSGLQHTQVGAVNQAYDQLTQLVTGGAQGASSFFGLLGGTPTTIKTRGGLQLQAPPAMKGMANALRSFTTAGGAAAWNVLTNQQSGLFPALQGQMDWLRQAQVMSALTPEQTTGMASFQMMQLLPMLRKSPAGLAMLSTYAQQYGGPGFAPGTSASAMFKGLSKFFARTGVGAKGYNRLMTLGTEGLANIGTDANEFVQNIGEGIGGPMSTAVFSHGEDLMKAFMNVAGHKGTAGALTNLANFMYGSGTPLKGAQSMVNYAAKMSGASPQSIAAMMGQIKKQYDIQIKLHADTGALKSALAGIKGVSAVHVKVNAEGVATASQQIQGIKGKNVTVRASASGVGAAQAAINSVHGKTVSIVVNTIMAGGGVSQAAMRAAGYAPGVSASQIAANIRKSSFQTGGMVPGSGQGDIIPAMLEPGEAIIPRYLVPLIAPILAAHRVPGFGGIPQSSASHFAAGGIVPSGGSLSDIKTQIAAVWKTLDKLYAEKDAGNKSVQGQINSIWANQLKPLYAQRDVLQKGTTTVGKGTDGVTAAELAKIAKEFTFTLSGNIAKEIKNSGAAKDIANSLVKKIGQEVALAKNVASAAMTGQGFGTQGLISGMDATPGTGGGSVYEQMQSYLGSVKDFTKDIATLRKGKLNKSIISQLIAAGPVQGDVLAQSIMNDYGGIKGVNSLWKQLGGATKGLGAQAAMAQYGGTLAPNLRSGTFVGSGGVNVNISVNAGQGGTLSLSEAQIKALVAKVQAALLKQAKRNNKTGIQLSGKGA